MKKIIFTILSLMFTLSTVYSQKGIDFNFSYGAGRSLQMFVDSTAKNVYYELKFPNQPNTAFNFLPDVSNISLRFIQTTTADIASYRYTILVDDKPIEVNKTFYTEKIFKIDIPDNNPYGDNMMEVNALDIGNFLIKGKIITVLIYSIEKPLDIYTYIFYAKPIPKAKMTLLAKRFSVENGVQYKYIHDFKKQTLLRLNSKDDEITIVKDKTEIDYIYHVVIKDKQSNKIIYESTAWQYGGYVDEAHQLSPYIKFDKSIFKKSGDYEISIEPMINWTNCLDCNMSPEEIEEYSSKYLITVDLEEEATFTATELGIYIGATCAFVGAISSLIMVYIKRKNKANLIAEQQQKQLAHLQLNSVRSQLNPHFLFNALAGIQNLMNKNEIDNANKYLSKFARLTRHVLDNEERISLSKEKSLLEDYLLMEQLRFGFQYQIYASTDLDIENIEIPSMLLQPFVENAVKHGIAEKGNDGKIEINFTKQSANLILQIKDNGQGFQPDTAHNGLGLALSKNRISLLNTFYKYSPISLDIQSNKNGTRVLITLSEWA